MHICECENPKYIYNPYLGEDVRTGCGVCASCLNQKASSWVSRLIQEGRAHKYSFMVNLTYDDLHLPKLFFDNTFENLVSDDRSLCIPLHELTSLCTYYIRLTTKVTKSQCDDILKTSQNDL